MEKHVVAFDLGASSGRAMLGSFDGNKLSVKECHRFENAAVDVQGSLYWDVLHLFSQMKQGLFAACAKGELSSMGIDTWGVDYALLDGAGRLLANPSCYRDARTDGMMAKAFAILPKEQIAQHTGLAFHEFNTLYQLLADQKHSHSLTSMAKHLLLMPDYLASLFCGEMGSEYTHASTTQLTDPRTRDWSSALLDTFGINPSLFSPMQEPGTLRGSLLSTIAKDAHSTGFPVVAVASHDTASAVVAVPAKGNFAYISSGTWSLVGVESDHPVINEAQRKYNLTNEGGAFGTVRVLKNVMGLWILQECRRTWKQEGMSLSFAEMCSMAEAVPPSFALIDADDHAFLYPGDMPQKVCVACRESGQRVPSTPGEIVRVVLDSLAQCYKTAMEQLICATQKPIDGVYIVGGGANNRLLNQLTADAVGLPVYAGPSEATAIGNILMQLYALGEIQGLAQMRELVSLSFAPEIILPQGKGR